MLHGHISLRTARGAKQVQSLAGGQVVATLPPEMLLHQITFAAQVQAELQEGQLLLT